MKVVTLMENTSCRNDLRTEHGLSLYIETEKCRILFDAGQSAAFADNAEKLGVDVSQVDLAVLSHGHYDHSGGLQKFLQINKTAPVYVSSHAFEAHYNAAGKYIGVDPSLGDNSRIRYVVEERTLVEGITLHFLAVMPTDAAGLTMEENGERKPEDFRHEQYLMVEDAGKKILISGCSHKGILNIVEAFRPDILIGGFHFMKIEEEEKLEAAAKKLREYDTVYYTGHCTGQKQYEYLKTIMGEKLHYIAVGSILEL